MKHLLALFALVALCGCQALSVDDLLSQAEQQIVSAPDSALVTVKSIKRYALINPKHRARYGVLYSAALDKNYIDVAADSLIRFSATYYDTHGPESERMRAYYYLGRVYENAKDYQQALLYYLDAAQHPDRVDNNYLKGLLYSDLSEIYERYYNYKKAYQYAEQSYNCYKEAKLERHQVFQLYMMGALCNSLGQYDKGITILSETIEMAKECGFQAMDSWSKAMLIIINNKLNNYEENYTLLRECESMYGDNFYTSVNLCGAAADVYARKGDRIKSEKLINKGWGYAKNSVDSSQMYYHLSKMHLHRNKLVAGYNYYNKTVEIQFATIASKDDESLATAQSEYFTQKAIKQKNRSDRNVRILIVVVLVGIVIAICLNIRKRREILRKNIQINQYMDVVNTLQKEIDSRDSKIQQITDDSLKDRCETINQLCRTYFETTHSKRQQRIIFNEVKTLVENLSSDAYLETVEKCVNQYCDNLLVQLKQDMPELSHNEYKLACFVCIGFSTQVMCLVFECTPEILYRRVYRLRDKIRHCPSEHKAKYLKYI